MKMIMAVLVTMVMTATAGNPSAAYIQRTMKTLEASTEKNPAHVRVMFYGQSIVSQPWTNLVVDDLKKRYPTVDFEFHKAAIGGYTSPLLIRTADHDLYPWYPDLLFFHVYGPVDKYTEIVKRTRERTSAEIVLWTSHLSSREKVDELSKKLDKRSDAILATADKYHCMKINLRKKWCDHLLANNIAVTNLLKDSVHMQKEGCDLYGGFICEELVRDAKLGDNPTLAGTISSIAMNDPAVKTGPDGSVTLKFTGNRVIAVSDGSGAAGASAKVLLDGKPMDNVKELWAVTRPSVGPAHIWMPAINNIGFEKTLLEEDWILTCLPDSTPDGKKIHYKIEGSKTGADGEGWSTDRFVSKSGRVIIEPRDWRVEWTLGYRKATLPEGFQVKWKSYPMFTASYEPKPVKTRTLLMQGCSNDKHTLTLIPSGGKLGIKEFIIHSPAK
jgi:hypothetical protein